MGRRSRAQKKIRESNAFVKVIATDAYSQDWKQDHRFWTKQLKNPGTFRPLKPTRGPRQFIYDSQSKSWQPRPTQSARGAQKQTDKIKKTSATLLPADGCMKLFPVKQGVGIIFEKGANCPIRRDFIFKSNATTNRKWWIQSQDPSEHQRNKHLYTTFTQLVASNKQERAAGRTPRWNEILITPNKQSIIGFFATTDTTEGRLNTWRINCAFSKGLGIDEQEMLIQSTDEPIKQYTTARMIYDLFHAFNLKGTKLTKQLSKGIVHNKSAYDKKMRKLVGKLSIENLETELRGEWWKDYFPLIAMFINQVQERSIVKRQVNMAPSSRTAIAHALTILIKAQDYAQADTIINTLELAQIAFDAAININDIEFAYMLFKNHMNTDKEITLTSALAQELFDLAINKQDFKHAYALIKKYKGTKIDIALSPDNKGTLSQYKYQQWFDHLSLGRHELAFDLMEKKDLGSSDCMDYLIDAAKTNKPERINIITQAYRSDYLEKKHKLRLIHESFDDLESLHTFLQENPKLISPADARYCLYALHLSCVSQCDTLSKAKQQIKSLRSVLSWERLQRRSNGLFSNLAKRSWRGAAQSTTQDMMIAALKYQVLSTINKLAADGTEDMPEIEAFLKENRSGWKKLASTRSAGLFKNRAKPKVKRLIERTCIKQIRQLQKHQERLAARAC